MRVNDVEMVYWRRQLQRFIQVAVAVDFTLVFMVLIGLTGLIPLIPKEMPICSSATCVQESRRITLQVSSEVKPCEDLYDFVCGNFQKKFDQTTALKSEAKRQIVQLYTEPIKVDEHPMVATMKNLFRACLNEASSQTSTINIQEIKKALKMAGGWPLLEGCKWDERKFNWLQATYKFRELGYHYKVFINLSINENPRNRSKHILEVSLPKLDVFNRKEIMKEIAIMFAANKANATSEVDETYDCMLQLLYEISNSPWNNNDHGVLSSVINYQQKQNSTINWLELINKIIRPAAHISHKDLVLFPHPETINIWFNLLSKIPKRIQANYMMWTVIEDLLTDLKFHEPDMQFLYVTDYSIDGCLDKMQKRFRMIPNPIDVMYIRKYLPRNKLQMVENLVNSVKATFLELMQNVNWLDINDKKGVIKSMLDMTNEVIIGAPKIYFQDEILDDMSVDLGNADEDNYLKVLLKVNKNYQSFLYKQIYSSVDKTNTFFWNLASATEESLHYYADSAIGLPATILQGTFFDENRPNYLNYGSLGSFIAAEYAKQLTDIILAKQGTIWPNTTQKGFLKIRRCFLHQVMDYLKINGIKAEWDFEMLHQSLSTHISYLAYQKWEKSNGVEPNLAGNTYSNYQLFWISAASFYCHQYLYSLPTIFDIHKQYSFYVSGIALNNDNFAKDFDCPLESKMNPLEKCHVF